MYIITPCLSSTAGFFNVSDYSFQKPIMIKHENGLLGIPESKLGKVLL